MPIFLRTELICAADKYRPWLVYTRGVLPRLAKWFIEFATSVKFRCIAPQAGIITVDWGVNDTIQTKGEWVRYALGVGRFAVVQPLTCGTAVTAVRAGHVRPLESENKTQRYACLCLISEPSPTQQAGQSMPAPKRLNLTRLTPLSNTIVDLCMHAGATGARGLSCPS
jgi:hypothetical protein